MDPLPASLDLKNNLMLSNEPCSEWRDALATDIRLPPRAMAAYRSFSTGVIPADCGEKTLYLSIHDNAYYILSLFTQLWEEQGGVFRGKVITGTVPERMPPLEIHQSPPLADIVRDINKFSNNTAARQLYLALGLATGRRPAAGPIGRVHGEPCSKTLGQRLAAGESGQCSAMFQRNG